LAAWGVDDGHEFVASGDAAGHFRIWDVASRVCVRILKPWTNLAGAAKTATSSSNNQHPVSSLQVLELSETTHANDGNTMQDNAATSSSTNINKAKGMWASRLPPLQKYAHSLEDGSGTNVKWTPAPFWNAQRNHDFWDVTNEQYLKSIGNNSGSSSSGKKRPRMTATTSATNNDGDKKEATKGQQQEEEEANEKTSSRSKTKDDDAEEEVKRLKQQLADANSTIARWETVNNQLMAKLQQTPSSSK
jgi:hypothetical protein